MTEEQLNEKPARWPVCRHGNRKRAAKRRRDTGGGDPEKAVPLWCNEPFRLFFPLALLVSIAGVSLWPTFYWCPGFFAEWFGYAPGPTHARLMIEGFIGGFAIGFLGTAMPRMFSSPRLKPLEVSVFLGLYVAMVVTHLTGRVRMGDQLFLALLAVFAVCMGFRFVVYRKDMPPPGFVLVGMGIAGAIGGTAYLIAESRGLVGPSPGGHSAAALFLYEGFILLPALGIGAFLFPRFVGVKSKQMFPDSLRPPAGWSSKAVAALVCGLAIWGTFVWEAQGGLRPARVARVIIAAGFLLGEVPLFRKVEGGGGSLVFALRTAVVFLLGGALAAAAAPAYRVGLDHLLYVSGFGLLALTVASRVIYGHAGKIEQTQGKVWPVRIAVWLIVLGATTRASAEIWPHIMISHHIYAAFCWGIAAVVWGWWLLPKLLVREEEEGEG